MLIHSPPASTHTLDIPALQAFEVSFWSAWVDNKLAGFGALKELSKNHGEIKSMRTASLFMRKGVGAKILSHIICEAQNRAYAKISLETGSMEVFTPARMLYLSFGFDYCPPFAAYKKDPYSVFMTKNL